MIALGFLAFEILPAIGALVFTLYLTYVRLSPSLLKSKMDRAAKLLDNNTRILTIHRKMYSTKNLVAWALISLSLVLRVASDFYTYTRVVDPTVKVFVQLVTVSLLFTGLYLWHAVYRKEKKD